MIRTIISLNKDEKKWLDNVAKAKHVPMTEIVRLAIKDYRRKHKNLAQTNLDGLLKKTQGIWSAGDGLQYQIKLRDEWSFK